jgi:hypothetical protein
MNANEIWEQHPVISVTDLLVALVEHHLKQRNAVNYAGEPKGCFGDVGDYGPLGRDAGDCLHDSVAPHDSGRTRMLQENGAAMRIIGDAFESFLLPRT